MAGWTYTGGVVPVGAIHGPDDGEKVTMLPTLAAGNSAAMQEIIWRARQFIFKEVARELPNLATFKFSANNSTGDTAGVGTFTLTIITT
jgi:hypothetical protein